jgi:hypothetical protein
VLKDVAINSIYLFLDPDYLSTEAGMSLKSSSVKYLTHRE